MRDSVWLGRQGVATSCPAIRKAAASMSSKVGIRSFRAKARLHLHEHRRQQQDKPRNGCRPAASLPRRRSHHLCAKSARLARTHDTSVSRCRRALPHPRLRRRRSRIRERDTKNIRPRPTSTKAPKRNRRRTRGARRRLLLRAGEGQRSRFPSASMTRTSPSFSARIDASIFERSPATIQVSALPERSSAPAALAASSVTPATACG